MPRREAERPLRVTILVQNLPVPFDRRVWCEASALRDAGARVSIVAHRGAGQPWRETLEGIECCRYPAAPVARGLVGYVLEFGWCWLATLAWCLRLLFTRGIDVIHACNPPDTFWAIAWLLRPFGVRFVYDQHDLCPELYRTKFPEKGERAPFLRALLWLERRTLRRADVLISPNPSYAEIARRRGGLPPERVFVVRSAPPRERFAPLPESEQDRGGHAHLVGYIGVMGVQDGVESLVQAARVLVREEGRDVGFCLIGDGDELPRLRALVGELDLSGHVELTGRITELAEIRRRLGSCDLGACPDPPTAFNDVSSMNKIVEYMALGLPVVGYDLAESRRTLAGGGILVEDPTPRALAAAIAELLDDPQRRAALGRANRERFLAELAWETQVPHLLEAYGRVGL